MAGAAVRPSRCPCAYQRAMPCADRPQERTRALTEFPRPRRGQTPRARRDRGSRRTPRSHRHHGPHRRGRPPGHPRRLRARTHQPGRLLFSSSSGHMPDRSRWIVTSDVPARWRAVSPPTRTDPPAPGDLRPVGPRHASRAVLRRQNERPGGAALRSQVQPLRRVAADRTSPDRSS